MTQGSWNQLPTETGVTPIFEKDNLHICFELFPLKIGGKRTQGDLKWKAASAKMGSLECCLIQGYGSSRTV